MKLKIFGITVPVKQKPNLTRETGWAGYYDITEKCIYLEPTLSKEERAHTLAHEFFHAVNFRTSMPQTKIPMEVFEIIVDTFATALTENFDLKPKRRKN